MEVTNQCYAMGQYGENMRTVFAVCDTSVTIFVDYKTPYNMKHTQVYRKTKRYKIDYVPTARKHDNIRSSVESTFTVAAILYEVTG